MNLENHGEMFLEPSARMDIPSRRTDGQTDRQGESNIPPPPPNLVAGYNNSVGGFQVRINLNLGS